MLLFLYGQDSYRRKQKLEQIINQFEAKNSSFSLQYFDLEIDGGFEDLKNFCDQQGFFSTKKLAIAKNIFLASPKSNGGGSNLKALENLFKAYATDQETTILISEEVATPDTKISRYKNTKKKSTKAAEKIEVASFDFLTKKPVLFQEFKQLTQTEIEMFIKSEAVKRNLNLDKSVIQFLAQIFATNTWGLVTTLDKLSLLSPSPLGGGGWGEVKIQVQDLSDFIDFKTETNIFNFINCILYKKPTGAKIKALEDLVLADEDMVKLFNILATRPNIDLKTLKNLADLDVAIKSGKMDYDLGILQLALD